jgi:hypothetical protein
MRSLGHNVDIRTSEIDEKRMADPDAISVTFCVDRERERERERERFPGDG